jgi:hypothetical protein
MEILHKGEHPKLRMYQHTCRRCSTVFKYKEYEAKLMPDFRNGDYLLIDCPVCGLACTNNLQIGTASYVYDQNGLVR